MTKKAIPLHCRATARAAKPASAVHVPNDVFRPLAREVYGARIRGKIPSRSNNNMQLRIFMLYLKVQMFKTHSAIFVKIASHLTMRRLGIRMEFPVS